MCRSTPMEGCDFFSLFLKKIPVSAHHYRREKICLNCGAEVPEKYCSRCGQPNTEPKESFWHLVGHFFADITHYDSQLFRTLRYLIMRPGFLTKEYMAGHRARYLNPVRLYVFISAVFFLVMFALSKKEDKKEGGTEAVTEYRQRLANSLHRAADSMGTTGNDSLFRLAYREIAAKVGEPVDTTKDWSFFAAFGGAAVTIRIREDKYDNVRQYDSAQRLLPDTSKEKDKGPGRWFLRKTVQLKEENGGKGNLVMERDFQHDIPRIMFVLLPLVALFSYLFYDRKKYFYVQHAIFSIHFHSFVFIFFLVIALLTEYISFGQTGGFVMFVITLLCIYLYLTLALRGAFGQSFGLSMLKAFGISLLYIISLLICLGVLFLITFLTAKPG